MSVLDNRTIGKPFSYLRPNMPMPRRYVEPDATDSSSVVETSTDSSGQSVASHADAGTRRAPSSGAAQAAKASAAKIPSSKASIAKNKPSKMARSFSDSTILRDGFSADRANTTALSPVGSASSLTSGSGAASPTSEGDWDDEYDDAETDKTTAATSEDALRSSGRGDAPAAFNAFRDATMKVMKKHAVVVAIVSLAVSIALIVVIETMPEFGDHNHGTEESDGQRPSEEEGEPVRYGGGGAQGRAATSLVTQLPELQATPTGRFTLADYEEPRTGGDETMPTGALECNTDACRWERRLVDEKLNVKVDPCVDFYSYVCSPAWEMNGGLPYKSAGRAFLIKETTRYLMERMRDQQTPTNLHFRHDEQSFLDHSSTVLSGCLNNTAAEDAAQWDGLRGLLEEVGLGSWPYVEPWTLLQRQSFQLDEVLKLVDRHLGVFPIVHASLRKISDESSYVIHIDAPRNFLLVQYVMQRTSKSLPYKEIIRQTLSLWKTLPRSNTVAEDVMRFEVQLFEASRSSANEARDKEVVYTMKTIPQMPRFNSDAYLSYLRGRNDRRVVVLKPAYIRKLSEILRKPSPRTILNFLGVLVVSQVAPLLPPGSVPRGLIRMGYPSFQHHVDPRTQSCFHLVNRLYPHGFRWILREILAKDTDMDLQWAATTRHVVTSLARTFREGTTWMQGKDVSNALKRLNSLQVNYLAGKEEQVKLDEYYASPNATHGSENLIGYYGDLLATSLQKYWETSPDGVNYDARFTERSTDLDAAWIRSPESALKVYITSSGVASASQVTQADLPSILLPLLAADVTGALFLSSLDEPQWSNWTRDRFQALRTCLLDHYESRVQKDNLSSTSVSDFFDDILVDNAAIKPLTVAYRHFSHGSTFVPSRRDVKLSAQKLFFINYAAGFCVPKSELFQARERMYYRWGLPPHIRVNLALLELKAFRDAFKCQQQSLASRCPVWKREDEATLWDEDEE